MRFLQALPFVFGKISNIFLNIIAVILITLLLIVSFAILYHINLSVSRKDEPPVVWSWKPLIGYAVEIGTKPIDFFKECFNQYGDIFGVVVGGQRMFLIGDCHSYHLIMKSSKHMSWEEFHNMILINFFGVEANSINKHQIDDDLMRKWFSQYLLSDKHLNDLTIRMQEQLHKNVEKTKFGTVKLYDFLSRFIFHASMSAMLNSDAGSDEKLYDAFLQFDKQLPLAAAGLSLDYFIQAKKARKVLTDACQKYKYNNSELMKKRWEYFETLVAEKKVKTDDIQKFQLAMMWASVGNTMPAVFWVFFYLINNPKIMEQVIQEVMNAYMDENNETKDFLNQEDLNNMILTDACITETLRLSSGSLIMRYVREPCELTLASGKSYKFRKGDKVGICPPISHLDSEIFHDSENFDPFRWIQGDSLEEKLVSVQGRIPLSKNGKDILSSFVYLPFGGGITYCPGRRFARNEIKALVVFLLMKFKIGWPSEDKKSIDVNKTMPNPGCDGKRAGLGIFPPKCDVEAFIELKNDS